MEHLAVADEEDAPGAARGLHGVRDHEDRLPAAVHLAEETEQLVRGFAVERAGRLVGKQDARLCDERAGNGGALLPSYTNGFYTCRDADVFVTRGLGGMVRILNRPEVAVVILRRN